MMKIIYRYIITVLILTSVSCISNDKNIKQEQRTKIAEANLQLGIAYLERRDYERSLKKLERARKADPNYAATYNVLGLLYQQLEQHANAEKSFKRAIKLDPKDSKALNNYGQFLCRQGRYNTAEKIFLRAAKNPFYETPELAYTNAGLCAQLNNKDDIAEIYYRQALELVPTIPQVLLNMAGISSDKGQWISARAYLQRYQEISQHSASSLWLGIRIEQQLGDVDTVASYGLLLKNQFPDSPEAQLYRESTVHQHGQ